MFVGIYNADHKQKSARYFPSKMGFLGNKKEFQSEHVSMVGHVQVHQNKEEDLLQRGRGSWKGLVAVSLVVLLHLY